MIMGFKEGMIHSEEASAGADRFVEDMRSGKLRMELLPNTYGRFSGELEESDYVSFCEFLKSRNGVNVLEMLDAEDSKAYVRT